MKRLTLSLILILCFCSLSLAQEQYAGLSKTMKRVIGTTPVTGGAAAAGGATAYCVTSTTCTSPNPGNCNLLCDDFESTVQWTTTAITGTPSLNYTVAPPTSACTDKGIHALELIRNDAYQELVIENNITDSGTVNSQVYVTVVSHTSADTNELISWGIRQNSWSNFFVVVSIVRSGAVLKLNLSYQDTSYANQSKLGTTTLATGTQYRVGLSAVKNAAAVVTLNGVTEITADTATVNLDGQVYGFAMWYDGGTLRSDIIFDNIAISSGTAPLACNQ
jgi:hypothetical protein